MPTSQPMKENIVVRTAERTSSNLHHLKELCSVFECGECGHAQGKDLNNTHSALVDFVLGI